MIKRITMELPQYLKDRKTYKQKKKKKKKKP